jgi:phosphoglycolate phosphatase
MIGDRFYDIEGAHNFGMDCIAVLYGYGTREEFEKYGAEYIFDTPKEISKFLMKLISN